MPADLHAVPPPPDEPPGLDPPREPPSWRQGSARQRLLNDARYEWTRRRHGRRALVASFAVLVLGGTAALWFVPELPLLVTVPIGALPALVLVIGALNLATRGAVDLRTEHLDERQIAVRARAHAVAYRLVLAASIVGYAVLVACSAADTLPAAPARWLALGYLVFATLWLLPTLVIAWAEED